MGVRVQVCRCGHIELQLRHWAGPEAWGWLVTSHQGAAGSRAGPSSGQVPSVWHVRSSEVPLCRVPTSPDSPTGPGRGFLKDPGLRKESCCGWCGTRGVTGEGTQLAWVPEWLAPDFWGHSWLFCSLGSGSLSGVLCSCLSYFQPQDCSATT